MKRLNEDKKEELRNIFCYLYYNDELTNVVPAKITSYEFNLKMQQFYKNYEKIQKKNPKLYESVLKKWIKKKNLHFNNNIELMGFKELSTQEIKRIQD